MKAVILRPFLSNKFYGHMYYGLTFEKHGDKDLG